MTFNDIKQAKKTLVDQKTKYEANREKERKRRFEIISGDIKQINISVNLQKGEEAYFESPAQRLADKEHSEFYSTGKTKSPFITGGLLRGKSITHSTTVQQRITRNEVVDHGKLLFTSKRIVFIGKEVVSLPYDDLLSVEFYNSQMVVKYPQMLTNEAYELDKDAKFYYEGIMHMVKKDKGKVTEDDVDMSDYPVFVSEEEKRVMKKKSFKKNAIIFVGIATLISVFFHSVSMTVLVISVFVFCCSAISYPIVYVWNKVTDGGYEAGLQMTKTIFFWSIPIMIFCFILSVVTYH